MRSLWVIAMREYAAAVFTKAFVFGILFAPLLMGLVILFSKLLEDVEEGGERRIAVVDLTGEVFAELKQIAQAVNEDEDELVKFHLERVPAEPPAAAAADYWRQFERIKETQGERVRNEEISGFLVIGARVLDLEYPDGLYDPPADEDSAAYRDWEALVAQCSVAYGAENITDLKTRQFIKNNLNRIVKNKRYALTGIDKETVGKINRQVNIDEFKVKARTEPQKKGQPPQSTVVRADADQELLLPIGFMILLAIAIMTSAGPMLNNTIEEKSNRVMEVLLASATPFQILTGKIIGNALMGLTVTSIWGGVGLFSAVYYDMLPEDGVRVGLLFSLVLFFVTGYLIYGSLYGAVGSICMTIQEAQNFMTPMILLIVLPMVSMAHVVENPGSPVSVGLSMFPFSAPFVMMVRLGLTPPPPLWQLALSIALMLLGVVVAMWASAKVFRIAILLYGKPPSFRQLYRWVFSQR